MIKFCKKKDLSNYVILYYSAKYFVGVLLSTFNFDSREGKYFQDRFTQGYIFSKIHAGGGGVK